MKYFFFLLIIVFFQGCKGEDVKEVVSARIEPANSTVTLEDAFVTFSAIATYDDDSTGDITGKMTWKSFSSFQTDSSSDLLFQDNASSLAVLTTAGLFTIQATWAGYYDSSNDLKVYTRITVE